jgi:hypothetical protein
MQEPAQTTLKDESFFVTDPPLAAAAFTEKPTLDHHSVEVV